MVITPQQTLKLHKREEINILRKLEVQIDQNLVEGKTVMPIAGGLNAHIRHCIVNRYKHAGWEVLSRVEPNEGEYLLFTEHKEVRGFRPY